MKGFEPVTLTWQGAEYTVPAERVFELVRIIETEIMRDGNVPAAVKLLRQSVTYADLSSAYAKALQFAGASVRPDEVYSAIIQGFADDNGSGRAAEEVAAKCLGLLAIIAPPIAVRLMAEGTDEKK